LLEDAILTKIQEFIINERKLDNIYNILMCSYRKMEAHNKQLLVECLLKNGYMPQWNYFSTDDWEIVFSLEKQDPLILIKLYNSKQQNVYSEYWNGNIKFNVILEELSNLDEKQLLSGDYEEEWVTFFKKY